MLKNILCLLLLATSCGTAQTISTPSPATNTVAGRSLILEKSTMELPTAWATLIVGPLTRTNGIYVGDFRVKVFPYYFKSDWGRLAINVPDQALAAINHGKPAAITGTSTSGKNGVVRQIQITANPKDSEHGTVSLWFMVEDRKMTFNPAYQFTNNVPTTAQATPNLMTSVR